MAWLIRYQKRAQKPGLDVEKRQGVCAGREAGWDYCRELIKPVVEVV